MIKKETIKLTRETAQGLAKKLKEIDPHLLIVIAAGNPALVKNLPVAPVEPLSLAILKLPSDSWEQQSWHDVWKDSSGWTDVWGQSPGDVGILVAAPEQV